MTKCTCSWERLYNPNTDTERLIYKELNNDCRAHSVNSVNSPEVSLTNAFNELPQDERNGKKPSDLIECLVHQREKAQSERTIVGRGHITPKEPTTAKEIAQKHHPQDPEKQRELEVDILRYMVYMLTKTTAEEEIRKLP